MYTIDDYDYKLDKKYIAQNLASPPESCKLLWRESGRKGFRDLRFFEIVQYLDDDVLMVFNDTKVLPARVQWLRQQGDKINQEREVFYLKSCGDPCLFEALVRPGRVFRVGKEVEFRDGISFHVIQNTDAGRILRSSIPIHDILLRYGMMPLPPYIEYKKEKGNAYQPVLAQNPGSVASPTASLHFSRTMFDALDAKKISRHTITLHVGLGTFRGVDTYDITKHRLHAEEIEISVETFVLLARHKIQNKPILAVGTTVLRSLESLPYVWRTMKESGALSSLVELWNLEETEKKHIIHYRDNMVRDKDVGDYKKVVDSLLIKHGKDKHMISFQSSLFIYPGFTFSLVDQLITNFHLPKSSLLMLVAGFMGYDNMKKAYDHALAHDYRFYSFGDAMWLIRNTM